MLSVRCGASLAGAPFDPLNYSANADEFVDQVRAAGTSACNQPLPVMLRVHAHAHTHARSCFLALAGNLGLIPYIAAHDPTTQSCLHTTEREGNQARAAGDGGNAGLLCAGVCATSRLPELSIVQLQAASMSFHSD